MYFERTGKSLHIRQRNTTQRSLSTASHHLSHKTLISGLPISRALFTPPSAGELNNRYIREIADRQRAHLNPISGTDVDTNHAACWAGRQAGPPRIKPPSAIDRLSVAVFFCTRWIKHIQYHHYLFIFNNIPPQQEKKNASPRHPRHPHSPPRPLHRLHPRAYQPRRRALQPNRHLPRQPPAALPPLRRDRAAHRRRRHPHLRAREDAAGRLGRRAGPRPHLRRRLGPADRGRAGVQERRRRGHHLPPVVGGQGAAGERGQVVLPDARGRPELCDVCEGDGGAGGHARDVCEVL